MTNRPRPKSSRADMVSAGSNIVQNFQLAKSNRLQEESNVFQAVQTEQQIMQTEMQAQQLAMEQSRERKRLEIIEKRKLLIKFEDLCDRAVAVFPEYPEYSAMMMENARDSFQNWGLSSDHFEEIPDMERSTRVFSLISGTASEFRNNLDDGQTNNLASMREFLDSEDSLMEEHARLCQDVEEMANSEGRMNELLLHKEKLDSLHQERFGVFLSDLWKQTKRSFIAIGIGVLIVVLAMSSLAGDCVEYDADDVCQTYENQTVFMASIILFMVFGIPITILPWWAIYAFYQSREFRREWAPFEGEFAVLESLRQRIISNNGRFQMLSERFQTSSSYEAIEMRTKKKDWVDSLIPNEPEKKLFV